MSDPLVSVVIPSYNRAQYIAETIESVLAQTYQNIEAIVIDDGSTDNTRDVVEPYVPKVRYVWQENSERGASRNHGLRLANGEFIAFLDSDDLWEPRKLEEDLRVVLNKPDAGVVYSDVELIDSNGSYLKSLKRKGYSGNVTDQLLTDNFVSIGAHLIRKKLADDVGGFREERDLSGSEDWEFWVRLSCVTEFEYLPKATTKIRTHVANTMTNPESMTRSMSYALELVRYREFLTAHQKRLLETMQAKMALVNAINNCSGRRYRQTIDHLLDAVKCSPGIVLDPRYPYTIFRILTGAFRR